MPSYTRLEQIAGAEIARLSAELPSEVREALDDLPVHLQALPDEEVASALGDDLLGLFSGEALHERGESLDPSPPQIHLYLENIWEEAGQDLHRYKEEIGITFLHELGHYLGWDEDEMEQHGLE